MEEMSEIMVAKVNTGAVADNMEANSQGIAEWAPTLLAAHKHEMGAMAGSSHDDVAELEELIKASIADLAEVEATNTAGLKILRDTASGL